AGDQSQSTPTNNLPESSLVLKVRKKLDTTAGDRLLLITDGVLQAQNANGEEFGYQRLIAAAEEGRGRSASELGETILQAVTEFRGGELEDDASLVVVKSSG
ncbi:MAG: PP2C family protein-serine/threonine phosphatase, partial [Acidobacteriota bacterium]